MTLEQLNEMDCEISNLILSTEKLKAETDKDSMEYVILVSKEIAYTECLNLLRRYL